MADIQLMGNYGLTWGAGAGANYFQLERVQAIASGTIRSIKFTSLYSGGLAKIAIYADIAGAPGSLLVQTDEITSIVGSNQVDITPLAVVSGAYYWIAENNNLGGIIRSINTGGNSKYKSVAYSGFTFPDPIGTGFSSAPIRFSMSGWGPAALGGVGLVGDGLVGEQVFFGPSKFFG